MIADRAALSAHEKRSGGVAKRSGPAKVADELHQRAHRSPRGSLCDPRFVLFHPGHAGDVEMDPWRVAHELLQKHRSSDRAAPTAATVYDVCDVRLDHVAIFVV